MPRVGVSTFLFRCTHNSIIMLIIKVIKTPGCGYFLIYVHVNHLITHLCVRKNLEVLQIPHQQILRAFLEELYPNVHKFTSMKYALK